MDIKPTLIAISNDARGWLKVWAHDFTEAEARLPGPASRLRIHSRGSWVISLVSRTRWRNCSRRWNGPSR
jgi:hypothetical protein